MLLIPVFHPTPPLYPSSLTLRQTLSCSMSKSSAAHPTHPTRRAFISSLGALCALSFSARLERADAVTISELHDELLRMRGAVDRINGLITGAKWDAVRTVLATAPVVRARDTCNALQGAVSGDEKPVVVALREDLLSGIRLLDTAVYANVFIGEDRQILGTKVDYDVPRLYLADVKEALDALAEIAADNVQ